MAPNGFFITGTDTDVGKTVAAAWMILHLGAAYWKPVQSGTESPDADVIAALTHGTIYPSTYTLTQPLSPHESAKRDGVTIDMARFVLPETDAPLIVEGAGGLLVPLNDKHLVIDLMAQLDLPAVLVARSGLGTINHTLLSLEALRARNIPVAGVIMSGPKSPHNREALEDYGRAPIIAEIDQLTPLTQDALLDIKPEINLTSRVPAQAGTQINTANSNQSWAPVSTGARDVLAVDKRHIWHPFTQHGTEPDPIVITSAKEASLYAEDGTEYLDLISSWWTNIHGHAHPVLSDALSTQANTMEHVMFAGFTHPPAAALSEKLTTLLPGDLTRVFFSDNGSTAVEVALKLAYQYWFNHGETNRTKFITFDGAYHGDTVGAMSVGKGCGYFKAFDGLLFETVMTPYPATFDDDPEVETKERAALDAFEKTLNTDIAAVIVEPLVQGASGMRMCRPDFIKQIVARARAHGVLVIFDEVAVGFGRTGNMFACDKIGVVPDLICLSKGLTAGYLPMSVTVCTDNIYQAFLGKHFAKAFAHGHSFTGNPLGCAVALASLQLFEQEKTLDHVRRIEEFHRAQLSKLKTFPIHRPRVTGTIMAFDLTETGTYKDQPGEAFRDYYLKHGLNIRPLGNTVYLLPPYCITDEQLHRAYEGIYESLSEALEIAA